MVVKFLAGQNLELEKSRIKNSDSDSRRGNGILMGPVEICFGFLTFLYSDALKINCAVKILYGNITSYLLLFILSILPLSLPLHMKWFQGQFF